MKRIALSVLLFTVLLAAVVTGCGGGGGSATPGGGSGSLGVFVTDAFNDDYGHVWVRIHKVELLDAAGSTETLFDDATGVEIDLKTLRDATGQRFALLANAAARSRTHTQVRVTLGDTVVLFPGGSATGQNLPLADAFARDGAGHPILVFPLAAPRNLGSGNDDLVIDFDLAGFTLVAGKVAPALREGEKTGLQNPGRQEGREFSGTIANLAGTAPNFTFTLNTGAAQPLTVVTNAATRIFNNNAAPNPQLTNGRRVEVRGTFDVTSNQFTATAVKIKNEDEDENEAEVKGAPSAVNAAAGTFVVAAGEVQNFLPTQTTVAVVTTANTVFRSDRGVLLTAPEFFAALPSAAAVEVEGVYDAATNTLTARKAKLDDPDDNVAGQVEARGRPTIVNAATGTFQLSPLDEWEGFVPSGAAVAVVTNAGTRFRDSAGNEVSASVFFAALPASPLAQVEGAYAGGTITAMQARLRNNGSGGDD